MPATVSSSRRNALRMARRFVAPYRWRVLGALLALMFTAAITLSMGQGIRLLVDQGLATQSQAALNQSIGLFFVLVLALAAGTFSRFYLVSWIGERFVADIRMRVFNHLINLHPGFYESNRSSEIQSRLTADTTLLQTVIGSSLSMALRNVLMLIGGIILLFVTNPKLTAIVIVALPLVVAPILIFGRRVRALSRQTQDRVADVGSYVGGSLQPVTLATIYKDNQMYAYFNVADNQWLGMLMNNRQSAQELPKKIMVQLGKEGSEMYPATLDYLSPNVDLNTGTLTVRANFDNPQGILKSGLYVSITLPYGEADNAMLVKEASIGTDQLGKYLYLVNDSNIVRYRHIEIGQLIGDTLRQVTGGLSPQDRYVTKALMKVRDGMKIKPMP